MCLKKRAPMKHKITVIIPTYNQQDNIHIGLDSLPSGVEIIVVDDGSTDETLETVLNYKLAHPEKHITIISFAENKGVSFAINAGLDKATGEYIVLLGSDGDYFLPETFDYIQEFLNGYDLVYFDIIDNSKHIRHLSPKTVNKYVGAVKFMKRSFIGDIRCPTNRRRAEDVIFNSKLQAKHPKSYFTNKVLKHYNYPRVGSLTWNARHGVTDAFGFGKEKP